MVDNIEVSRPMRGSFVITESTIRNIYRHLSEAMQKPASVSVSFANDRTISSEDLGAILMDSAVANFPISNVRLTCGDYSDPCRATVTLGLSGSRAALLEIKGDRKFCLGLEDSIVNELEGVKSPLSRLNPSLWSGVDTNVAVGIISSCLLLIILAFFLWGQWIYDNVSPFWITVAAFSSNLFFIAGPFIAPATVFDLGKGRVTNERRRWVINFAVSVVIVGIAINFISSRLFGS